MLFGAERSTGHLGRRARATTRNCENVVCIEQSLPCEWNIRESLIRFVKPNKLYVLWFCLGLCVCIMYDMNVTHY